MKNVDFFLFLQNKNTFYDTCLSSFENAFSEMCFLD